MLKFLFIMANLELIGNEAFLKELRNRIEKKTLSQQKLLQVLSEEISPLISKCDAADLSNLTREDLNAAYQSLEKDSVYQAEVRLWDDLDDIDEES